MGDLSWVTCPENCLQRRERQRLDSTLCRAVVIPQIVFTRSQCHPAAAEGAKLSTMRPRPPETGARAAVGLDPNFKLQMQVWYLLLLVLGGPVTSRRWPREGGGPKGMKHRSENKTQKNDPREPPKEVQGRCGSLFWCTLFGLSNCA